MKLLLLNLLLMCTVSLFASDKNREGEGTLVLAGSITDASTHKPVDAALVTVVFSSSKKTLQKTYFTDKYGRFRIPQLPAGSVIVRVMKTDYHPVEKMNVTLQADGQLPLDIQLVPDAERDTYSNPRSFWDKLQII
jgi:Ca-activated chloride channel family protein